ncbi:hypothetical protein C0992_010022 [Termitomyces sp. T32_za158]|nr:hypothetical protein C0992_010022 [Termitomyces sp. T32_za158]
MSLFPFRTLAARVEADLICSDVEPATFFDGNLILLVEEMTFHVHAFLLVRQSLQFMVLWEDRPSTSNAVYTVRIVGEDPVDFAFMFMAIYGLSPYAGPYHTLCVSDFRRALSARGPLAVDAAELQSGVKRTDGSIARLDPVDVVRVCVGKQWLLSAQQQYTWSWLFVWQPGDACTDVLRYSLVRDAVRTQYLPIRSDWFFGGEFARYKSRG